MGFLTPLVHRFCRDERGVFAVVFGVMSVVLIALGGAVVDYVTVEQNRTRAQTAMDAAALALQPLINDPKETNESIRAKAEAFVLERIGPENVLSAKVDFAEGNADQGKLKLAGEFTVSTIFVRLVGVETLTSRVSAEAMKGIVNVEVAVALDVTGSMEGARLKALKEATNNLIDTVLKMNTTGNYAKIALVPYAQSVNAGPYADAIRGPIRPKRKIQSIQWNSGGFLALSSVSKDNTPKFKTSLDHNLAVNDYVFVRDTGVSSYDNTIFRVASVTSKTEFTLSGAGKLNNALSNKGSIAKCLRSDCKAILTSNNHGYLEGEKIWIAGAQGLTTYNDTYQTISGVTSNSFVLETAPNRTQTHTANTGEFWCRWQTASVGCIEYVFTGLDNKSNLQAISTCVTERANNLYAATDTPPSTSFMGRNYPHINSDARYSNECTKSVIVPLTDSPSILSSAVDGMTAAGSTSGSLGILWSWYMLSPNFGYVWQTTQPAPYRERNLLKAAIIMTDGEFNTVHCNGVVSGVSSTTGSGNNERINCAAPNGDPYKQAKAYCDAMKANTGIQVFTVGFGITAGSNAATALQNCASGLDKYFLADNAASLNAAFAEIARQISALRLTQ